MNMVNKQITITWNTKGLPMEQSNGHYPNETETVTVLSEDDKTFIPGMPTMVPMGLTKEQEEAYICKLIILCLLSNNQSISFGSIL